MQEEFEENYPENNEDMDKERDGRSSILLINNKQIYKIYIDRKNRNIYIFTFLQNLPCNPGYLDFTL